MIRNLFRRKKTEPEQPILEEMGDLQEETTVLEKENVDLTNKTLRMDYIRRLYDGICEAKRQCEEIKAEYAQVTSHLKDIQLMDQALLEDRSVLEEAARAIVELTRERETLRNRKYKFTDAQKTAMENFEHKAAGDIKKLKEYEEYQIKVKNDLRQLDSEKKLLFGDQADIMRSQNTLRLVSKVLGLILAMFGILLLVVLCVFQADIRVPFLATVTFAFLVALVITIEARKNRTNMVIVQRKCNRAIYLANKVKIKYFNNVRTIDYMCSKYRVRNATELEFVYDQYCRAKREWARQREDAFLLNEKNEILVASLANIGVKDKEIWFHQANAIVDPKEMVEVRHDLNEQRQKLRGQIDYNNAIMQDFLNEMERIRDKSPEYAKEIEMVLGEN